LARSLTALNRLETRRRWRIRLHRAAQAVDHRGREHANTAAFHAGNRMTARKKNSVQTGMAAASVESHGFPSGSTF